MRAVLLRRVAVLAVCALGVAALYHVPSPTPAPRRAADPEWTGAVDDSGARQADVTPPEPVSGVTLLNATADAVTVAWRSGRDDASVAGYRVWVNGFPVAGTADTAVRVGWFPDDGEPQVVQVRAVDTAGNLSATARSVLATPPPRSAGGN